MAQDVAKKNETNSVFLQGLEQSDEHIVDTLIKERCPSFAAHWSWPLTRRMLYAMLGYRKARNMADTLMELNGRESFEYLSRELDVQLTLHHFDRLPERGRVVVACNHPTGLADGVAVWDGLIQRRKDVVFFANADAMRVNPQFEDVIIPIEWVAAKRSPAKTRETLKRAAAAFDQEKCVVIFPSGKLAKKQEGVLTEQPWFSTVVSLARKQGAPIVPLHVGATNSRLFYRLSKINGELRDITLFHELLNKKRAEFDLIMGKPIPTYSLMGEAGAVTEQLKHHTAYLLADNADAEFRPLD
jgi:putative hemolysin